MAKALYSHLERSGPEGSWTDDGPVALARKEVPNCPNVLSHAQATLRLAAFLGIGGEELSSPAPLLSRLCGRRMFFLRGWKRFTGCVKGFNALGLLAEHAAIEEDKLKRLSPARLRRSKLEFLASRGKAFSRVELDELDKIDTLSLSLWRAFARRTIVCATSSNLGISLHQALRALRAKELRVGGKRFPLFNKEEGRLVIWCPDEKADFMSPEKSAALRRLANEAPRLTSLRPYINRQQRDPGALKEALVGGGYFFPTNPQSRRELRDLLTHALRQIPFSKLRADPKIKICLESLGASLVGRRVLVRSAVEGGMFGMAVPYLTLLEEARRRGGTRALCVWNPASIGAALAAMVLCDRTLPPKRGLAKRIHGVFDIANLQSLAQLFGVTVERHRSGRQTAYVGLGSSSYANGNLCFDILRESAEKGGAFRGRRSLHPATHTLNPIAQALVYAEELARAARSPLKACRKPEPAGAAALAGYLLARLDGGTLSCAEIAYTLRTAGFSKASFLEFCGLGGEASSARRFILQAGEEGPYMESLARDFLSALDRDLRGLRKDAAAERKRSVLEYRRKGLDERGFEGKDPAVHIHLTGDDCAQPSPRLTAALLQACERSVSDFTSPSRTDTRCSS